MIIRYTQDITTITYQLYNIFDIYIYIYMFVIDIYIYMYVCMYVCMYVYVIDRYMIYIYAYLLL